MDTQDAFFPILQWDPVDHSAFQEIVLGQQINIWRGYQKKRKIEQIGSAHETCTVHVKPLLLSSWVK